MGYVLRDRILVKRPIVFLCGPYYQKTDKSDRRNIMRSCFRDNYGDNVLPLIIDDFLTEENIKDSTVNIQLLEEIFAAISFKTYIFLDTLSAASELGLFMNHAFNNKVVAYIPKESDILNKKNVGYFVKDVILKMNSEQAKCLEYRPAVTRSVISTDYAVEHYGFIGDVIPDNIADEITNDDIYKNRSEEKIVLKENEDYPKDDFQIFYQKRDGETFLHTSISLIFYVVSALMYEKYQNKLVTNKSATIADFDVNCIRDLTKEVFRNYLIKNGIPVESDLGISTILKYSFEDIVYHLVTFCYVYHCFSTYKGLRLVDKHMDTVLETYIEIKGNNPLKVFNLSEEEYELVVECEKNPTQFYEKFSLSKGRKKRELIKYVDSEKGSCIRKIHEKMVCSLRGGYISSESSFAYKKGGSVKKCVEFHRDSNAFVKYDISKFFNSININNLFDIIEKIFDIDPAYEEITKKIIASFYVEGKLPLGLVVSPILSDIYMLEFDEQIINYCKNRGYIYTRYADDIMFSKNSIFTDEEYEALEHLIDNQLSGINLKINQKKKKKIFLEKDGQHIKYIGVNIVHFDKGNRLSVGRQYVYDVVKEYYKYLEELNNVEIDNVKTKEYLFYEERRIAGKISFIKSIEGKDGWKRIVKRLGKNTQMHEGERLYFGNIS